ncbi:MAG: TonB family protein, partial [Deltaproteobacteria bacterium]|nr:TonB family protein [Deltaproteobacteria bacterium]
SVCAHGLVAAGWPHGEPPVRLRPAERSVDGPTPVELIEVAAAEPTVPPAAEPMVEPMVEPVAEPTMEPELEASPSVADEPAPQPPPRSRPPVRPSPPTPTPSPRAAAVPDGEPATPAGVEGSPSPTPDASAKRAPRRLKTTLSNRKPARGDSPAPGGKGPGPRSGCAASPSKPRPTTKVPIRYTAAARAAQRQGRLILRARVSPAGRVTAVEVLRSVGPEVDGPAVAAFEKWRFSPAEACGEPVASTFTIARDFDLGD